MKKILTLTAIGVVLAANANASGFHLKEQSVSAIGNAFAGATAGAEDISFSYFNPAGLTRHKGNQFSGGVSYVTPSSKVRNSHATYPIGGEDRTDPSTWTGFSDTQQSGNVIKNAAVPNLYVSHQLNDKFTLGLSFNVPVGMISKYDNGWAGNLHGTLSDVKTYTMTPMVAYKVDEKVSIGVGMQIQHITARLRNAVNVGVPILGAAGLEGDTTDIGYVLGVMYEYSDQTRFGLGYRSRIKHKLKGDLDVSLMGNTIRSDDINARITSPALLSVGAYHDINEKWSVMAEFQRTYWEDFNELDIKGTNGTVSQTDENWKNTQFYAIGASYKVDDKWKLKAGLGFDKSAVKKEYKTPRIPDSDRNWYSLGVQYKHNEKVTFDAGYTYIKAKKASINISGLSAGDMAGGRGSLSADYKSYVHIFSVGATYRF